MRLSPFLSLIGAFSTNVVLMSIVMIAAKRSTALRIVWLRSDVGSAIGSNLFLSLIGMHLVVMVIPRNVLIVWMRTIRGAGLGRIGTSGKVEPMYVECAVCRSLVTSSPVGGTMMERAIIAGVALHR